MTLADIEAAVTAERIMSLNTDAREHPSQGEIARLAYAFYEMRGRQAGQDVDDWLSAERELAHHYR